MDLKKSELRVLRALSSYDAGADLVELTKHLRGAMPKGSIAGNLKRLVRRGFIRSDDGTTYNVTSAGSESLA